MKSFEELFNEYNNDEEINEIGQRVLATIQKKKIIALCLCTVASIIMLFALISKYGHGFASIWLAIIEIIMLDLVIIGIITAIYSKSQKEFIPVFKEKIVSKLTQNFLDNIKYYPKDPIAQETYKEANYEQFNEYKSEDLIKAELNNKYLVEMGEIEAVNIYSNSNGDVRRDTVFKGLFLKIDIEKNIIEDFRITSLYQEYPNKLEMDSSEFEKDFNVYTSNKIKGMQILTADIMEEILKFKNKCNYLFDIYLKKDKLYLRFYCGRALFEPQFKSKVILDEKSLREYYDILNFSCELTNKIIRIINEVEI